MKRGWWRGIAIVLVLLVAALGAWLFLPGRVHEPSPAQRTAEAARLGDSALIARGQYLATAGDCAACHTERGGQPYAGGRALTTPFGDVTAPNLTPDAATGLGQWSFEDFWRALHEGQGRHGEPLYPVFSYTSFTKVTREDAQAIFAYLKSLPPVSQPARAPELPFPYNVRGGLRGWQALYFKPGVYQADASKSAQWNRGAYLVQGLGHCNECHTTRNALGAMDSDQRLAGGQIPAQGWYAPDLSTAPGGGLAGWSNQDIVDLLKTGQSAKGAAFGPMADVVRHSTQHLSDADLAAMAVYLQSLPSHAPVATPPVLHVSGVGLAAGDQLYAKRCADCHGKQGEGVPGVYPPLAGNSTVTEPSGINAVRSVLLGGFAPATVGNPEPYSMPPFAQQLSDEEVAMVVSYIRQSFGNHAGAVLPADVGRLRHTPVD